MTEQPRTRQEPYHQIRQTSKQEFILSEMPKQCLEESRSKHQETQEHNGQKRLDRITAWNKQQQHDITYLGEGVSKGLQNRECDRVRLQQNNLPVFETIEDLATAMKLTVSQLRFLAFSRKTSTVSHYVRFKIAKKTGGDRLISAPMPRLKRAQHWILDAILEKVAQHPASHGFRRGRSIITNARPHVGAAVVINLDLKDFFPSINYKRIKGIFQTLGYSEAIATVLGLVCTESDMAEGFHNGKTYFVALGDRHLPQGAPTSPALTNILCRRLDSRLSQMASVEGYTYTRYADDLTFSGDDRSRIPAILKQTDSIVKNEGLTLHPDKTRVQRSTQQQEVTGIVVNEKLNIDRTTLKNFRATLHHIEKDGLAGKTWGTCGNLIAAIEGFANYVSMVNPDKGMILVQQVKNIKKKYGKRN